MKLIYYCEYCNRLIDTLEIDYFDESQLGFDILSPEEREELLTWSTDGKVAFVQIICENCEENLRYVTSLSRGSYSQ